MSAEIKLGVLASALGIEVNEPLLQEALTHRSASGLSYERLEFLGDRVLNLAVAAWVFKQCPQAAEGELSLIHTHLVRGETCAAVAEHLDVWPLLAPSILQGREQVAQGAARQRLLADAMEALLAVIYLKNAMPAVQSLVERHWAPYWDAAVAAQAKDAKTALQEFLQGQQLPLPTYTDVAKAGPDHSALFTVQVACSLGQATAQGPSKAAAAMRAATALLAQLQPIETSVS